MGELNWWPAPAKLNLMLRILGRRPDGYHDLQTVFQFIDYADQLAFDTSALKITRHVPQPDIAVADDLTLRAAQLLKQTSGVDKGVKIYLQKKLPIGGGMGGGSSNAATTLVVLNKLWGVHYTQRQLEALGLTLGADVPIFIRGHASMARGVGEAFTPIKLAEPWYFIIQPAVKVATAAVFQDPALTRNSTPITVQAFHAGDMRNDCLSVVTRRYPEVKRALEWLQQQSKPARLTGTGACVFTVLSTRESALALEKTAPPEWKTCVAQGKNVSSLLEKKS